MNGLFRTSISTGETVIVAGSAESYTGSYTTGVLSPTAR